MEQTLQIAQIVAGIQTTTLMVVGFIMAIAAFATAIGFAILGGKFLEGAARQPEMIPALQAKLFIIAGLLDAVPMIGVAISLTFMFYNPFLNTLLGFLPNTV